MTEEELIEYYANLLIMQYKGKPRADAHIRLIVKLCLMNMIAFQVAQSYDLSTAFGYQLDIIGKYQGVKRTSYTFTRQVTLNDENFRTLIQLAIIKNTSGSSLYEIDELINKYFGDQLKVYDFGSMRIGYLLQNGFASQDLAEIMIVQGLLPKPAAVSLSSTILYPTLDNFFGYSTYGGGINPNNRPYNTYADYNTDWPWITYKMIVGQVQSFNSFITTEIVAEYLNQENNGHMLT